MKLITFGECSFNMLYPSLLPFFYVIRLYFNLQFINDTLEPIPFFLTINMHLGQLIAGTIGVIITKCYETTIKKKKPGKASKILQLAITSVKRKDFKGGWALYALIFLIVSLDGMSITTSSLIAFYPQNEQLAFLIKAFQLHFTGLLSKYLLLITPHRHQKFAIYLTTLGVIPSIIPLITWNRSELSIIFPLIVSLLIINGFGISFYNVGEKYAMDYENISVSQMLLLSGSFGLVLNMSFLFFSSIRCNSPTGWCEFFFAVPNPINIFTWIFLNKRRTLFYFASIIMNGIVNVFYMATNKIFNPSHRGVCDIFSYVFTQVFYLIQGKGNEGWEFTFVTWIGNVLLIMGNLIYNEYIIIYICGLEVYTKKEILRRSKIDVNTCFSLSEIEINTSSNDILENKMTT